MALGDIRNGSSEFEMADGYLIVADYVIGTLMIPLTLAGVFGNAMVIILFMKHKCLNSPVTQLLRSMAFSDGLCATVGGSMYTVNCFFHKWIFYDAGCKAYAFVVFMCGMTSIAHLCAIAIERYIAIKRQFVEARTNQKGGHVSVVIVICWCFGLIWALLPLLGIQNYTVEGRVSCSIDWKSKRTVDYAMVVALFIGGYLLPIITLLFCYSFIWFSVHRTLQDRYEHIDRRFRFLGKLERKLAKTGATVACKVHTE